MSAHLWCRLELGEWACRPLDGPVLLPCGLAPATAVSSLPDEEAWPHRIEGPVGELAAVAGSGQRRCVVLCPAQTPRGIEWMLMATPSARVLRNGQPLSAGLAVLQDRDEIVVYDRRATGRWYISTEQWARVEPAPGGRRTCPRCKSPIGEGAPAVRCPSCAVWHHQDANDRECWTYTPRCASCHQQDTCLDGQLRWSPAVV